MSYLEASWHVGVLSERRPGARAGVPKRRLKRLRYTTAMNGWEMFPLKTKKKNLQHHFRFILKIIVIYANVYKYGGLLNQMPLVDFLENNERDNHMA